MSRATPDDEVRTLANALERLSPRSQQALTWRLLEQKTAAACAATLGVSENAFQVLFLRAAQGLVPSAPPANDSLLEDNLAAELSGAVERGTPAPSAAALQPLWPPLQRLRERGPELLREREARVVQAESSPQAAQRDFLRKLAIVLLVGVSLFLYWRERR